MIPERPPEFSPSLRPVGAFLLFLDADPLSSRGARAAVLSDDDLDDLLLAVPETSARWHILCLDVGRLVMSWENSGGADEAWPGISGGARLARYVRFGAGAPGAELGDPWGARLAEAHGASPPPAAPGEMLLDLETSAVHDHEGRLVHVVAALAEIQAHELRVLEWATLRAAESTEGPSEVSSALDAVLGGGVLPAGWEEMPIEDLRAVVEQAEAEAAQGIAEA